MRNILPNIHGTGRSTPRIRGQRLVMGTRYPGKGEGIRQIIGRYFLYPLCDKTVNSRRSNQTAYHSRAEEEKGHSGYMARLLNAKNPA